MIPSLIRKQSFNSPSPGLPKTLARAGVRGKTGAGERALSVIRELRALLDSEGLSYDRFGHKVRKRLVAVKLFAMSWTGIFRAAGKDDIVMATGHSCCSQVEAIDSRPIRHPVQIRNEMVVPGKGSACACINTAI